MQGLVPRHAALKTPIGNCSAVDDAKLLRGRGPLMSNFCCWQVKPPRIAESAVQLECKLRHTYDVKNRSVVFNQDTTLMCFGN